MSTSSLYAPSASSTSASSSDWLGTLIVAAKAMAGVGECLPFPFIKGLFSTSVVLLELIEKVGTNEDDLRDLAKSVFASIKVIHDELQAHGEVSAPRFEAMCKEFTKDMDEIASDLAAIQRHKPGFRKRFKKYLMASGTTSKISNCQRHMNELRTNFVLGMAAGTRLELTSVQQGVASVQQGVVAIRSEMSSISQRMGNPTPYDDNFRIFKEGEIYLLSATRTHSIHKYCSKKGRSTILEAATDYQAWINEGNTVKTVRVFKGRSAQDLWAKSLASYASLPRHLAFPQLFGMCKSPRFQALVFHEDLILPGEYTITLPTAVAKVEFEGNLLNDCQSAFEYLGQIIRKQPWELLENAFVNRTTGRLCISHLLHDDDDDDDAHLVKYSSPYWLSNLHNPTNHSCHLSRDPSLLGSCRVNIPLLMHHYHSLNTLTRHAYHSLSSRPGDVYLQDSRTSKRHLLAYIPPPTRWKDPFWSVGHKCSASQAPAGPGWTRFSVSFTPDLCGNTEPLTVYTSIGIYGDDDIRYSWLAQAHHIFTASNASNHGWDLDNIFLATQVDLRLIWRLVSLCDPFSLEGTFMAPGPSISLPDQVFVFIEDPQVDHNGHLGLPRVYWETEPTTAKAEMLQTGAFKLDASAHTITDVSSWRSHHYHALCDFHRECGIDPDSNEAARLLDLPLAQLYSAPLSEKAQFTGEELKYRPERWEIQEDLGPHSLLDCHKYSEFKLHEWSYVNLSHGYCNSVATTESSDHEDDGPSESRSQDKAPGSMSSSQSFEHNEPPPENSLWAKSSIVAEYPLGSNATPHPTGYSSLGWTRVTILILILILLTFGRWA